MEVEEICERIKEAYKSFSSYQASGLIRKNQMVFEAKGWFRMYYLKPNQLLLEWSEYGSDDELVLMIRGEKAQFRYKTIPKKMKPIKKRADIEKVQHVHLPVSMVAGASSEVSDSFLPLLIERTDRPCFINKKLARLRDETIDGEPCFQLREIYHPTQVWVSQKDFTVRRCRTDGHPILNEIFQPTMKALVFITDTFSRKPKKPPHDDDSMSEEWLFQNVQYNHLDENSFPKFEFERERSY